MSPSSGWGPPPLKADFPQGAGYACTSRTAAWTRASLAFIVVLSSLLAGCISDGADETNAVTTPPQLPEGLRFEDAEVLQDTPARFHAVWDTTAPLQPPTRPNAFDAVTTTLFLPAGTDYAFHTMGTWESSDDIDYRISHGGDVVCQAQKIDHPERCMVRWLPASDEDRTLDFELWAFTPHPYRPSVETLPAGPEVPVRILLEVRPTGPFGVPQPDWEDGDP